MMPGPFFFPGLPRSQDSAFLHKTVNQRAPRTLSASCSSFPALSLRGFLFPTLSTSGLSGSSDRQPPPTTTLFGLGLRQTDSSSHTWEDSVGLLTCPSSYLLRTPPCQVTL